MSMMALPNIYVHILNDNYDITQKRSFVISTETGLRHVMQDTAQR